MSNIAWRSIMEFTQPFVYGEDNFGMYMLSIRPTVRGLLALRFRHAMDGVTFVEYPYINDLQAAEIVKSMLVNTVTNIQLPIPMGAFKIEAECLTDATGLCITWYERIELAGSSSVIINGIPLVSGADQYPLTNATNGANLAVDATDTVTVTIAAGTEECVIENIGPEDVVYAYGQNTAAGARGQHLARSDDDGAGGLVLGTGGKLIEKRYKGTIILYAAGGAGIVRAQLIGV
jgi:hypothetical protein